MADQELRRWGYVDSSGMFTGLTISTIGTTIGLRFYVADVLVATLPATSFALLIDQDMRAAASPTFATVKAPNVASVIWAENTVAAAAAGSAAAALIEWQETSAAYVLKINTYYRHRSGFQKVTLRGEIKTDEGGGNTSLSTAQLSVNGVRATMSQGGNTYVEQGCSVDVSGLADNTDYPVTVSLKFQPVGAGSNAFLRRAVVMADSL